MRYRKGVLCVICILLLIGSYIGNFYYQYKSISYNNETSYKELITEKYSEEEVKRFIEVYWSGMGVYQSKRFFKVECIRDFGYTSYLMLLLEDGRKVFLFFDKEKSYFYKAIIIGEFKDKEDFSFVKIGKTTMKDMLEYDPSCFGSPFSSIQITGHFVKDGVWIIVYNNDENFTVQSMSYYPDEQVLRSDRGDIDFYLSIMPCILPMDKT